MENPIILFDGVCNFCNASVLFVLKRDKKAVLRFAPLQSPAGRRILERYHFPTDDFDTMLLVESDRIYMRSSAALRIVKALGGLWFLLYACILIPKPVRDLLYNVIARNRYKWFGKRETCMIPTPEMKTRFIEE